MAKAKKSEAGDKKPKTSLATTRRKRRARANPSPARSYTANPPVVDDLTHVIGPGFLAYAATRVLQRIVYSFVQKKWPKLGKHAHAIAGVAAFGGVWFFAHKIKMLARFHDGVLMGSGIAAGQGIAGAYLPQKYNWLLADCKPADVTTAAQSTANSKPLSVSELSPSGVYDEFTALEVQAEKQMHRMPDPRSAGTTSVTPEQVAASNVTDNSDLSDLIGSGDEDAGDSWGSTLGN